MNYLEALKKASNNEIITKKVIKQEEENIVTDEMNYELNVKDSYKINIKRQVEELCIDFVEECLLLEKPLLKQILME